jgi:hypothetical protein
VWNSYEKAADEHELPVVQYGTPKEDAPPPALDFSPAAAAPAPVSGDEFQALEQKVLRAVEIVRKEREARAVAEAEVAMLREHIEALTSTSQEAQTQITALNQERDSVRVRVERLLRQMDELL